MNMDDDNIQLEELLQDNIDLRDRIENLERRNKSLRERIHVYAKAVQGLRMVQGALEDLVK